MAPVAHKLTDHVDGLLSGKRNLILDNDTLFSAQSSALSMSRPEQHGVHEQLLQALSKAAEVRVLRKGHNMPLAVWLMDEVGLFCELIELVSPSKTASQK